MKKFTIYVSQNGWEYTGYVELWADRIIIDEDHNTNAIVARGNDIFTIKFDEEIRLDIEGD